LKSRKNTSVYSDSFETTKEHVERRVAFRRQTERKKILLKHEILTRNHLTTCRNLEIETIDKASYQQKRKEQVACNG
jgi:predicted ATPase